MKVSKELKANATFNKCYTTQDKIALLIKNGANVNIINNERKTGTYNCILLLILQLLT